MAVDSYAARIIMKDAVQVENLKKTTTLTFYQIYYVYENGRYFLIIN